MVQEATKKETLRIAAGTAAGLCLMFLAFGILHLVIPQYVPLNFTVFIGGILGGTVAVANFFLMGLSVQAVAAEKDDKRAYQKMKTSYTYRNLLQIVWIVLALVLPFVNGIAGIIPLLFPSFTVKIYYIFLRKKAAADEKIEERGDNE